MSSDPLFSLLLWSSVSTVPLFPLFLWSHSTVPLSPLFLWSYSTVPLSPLFLWSSVSTVPLSALFLWSYSTDFSLSLNFVPSCLWTEADQHSSFRQQIVRLAEDHLALSPVCHMCHQAPVRLPGTKLNRNENTKFRLVFFIHRWTKFEQWASIPKCDCYTPTDDVKGFVWDER